MYRRICCCLPSAVSDARWKKKHNTSYFGYENHALSDDASKFVRGYAITDASVHDCVPCLDLMPMKPAYADQEAFGDSAYASETSVAELHRRGFLPMVCERGYPISKNLQHFS